MHHHNLSGKNAFSLQLCVSVCLLAFMAEGYAVLPFRIGNNKMVVMFISKVGDDCMKTSPTLY